MVYCCPSINANITELMSTRINGCLKIKYESTSIGFSRQMQQYSSLEPLLLERCFMASSILMRIVYKYLWLEILDAQYC